MPTIKKLSISNLRNLNAAHIFPAEGINLIFGENGSGKTTFLEAIYLLGRAKTFRNNTRAPIIQHDSAECVLYADLGGGQSLGYSKNRAGEQKSHISGENAPNRAELANILPIQLLNADAFKILEGGPGARRAFIDWGVFHVEQGYISAWRMSQTALINRNSLLKQKAVQVESAQINAWTHELSHYAQQIDNFRLNYIAELEVALAETLTPLIALDTLKLKYFRGWDKAASLEEVLNRDLSKDRKLGFTSAGPHRADIKIQLGRQAAADVLSRGQQKLLVIAMKMAQATLLKKYSEQGCIFLADDLPAELDATNRGRVLALLAGLEEQVFVTGVDKTQLYEPLQNINELQLFHVKHGRIESV